jgi:hypothetical protein
MVNSYLYMGHGEDVCNHKGEPVILTVPPGSLYITSTVCGLLNYVYIKKLFEAFINKANENVWENPDLSKLKKVLEGILDTSTIHIHRPGDTYVENMFHPVSNQLYDVNNKWTQKWEDAKYYKLSESGLYRLSDILKKNVQKLPKIAVEKSTFLHKEGKEEKEITDFKIKKEDLLAVFENAIFPKLTPTEKKADYYTPREIAAINTKHKTYVSELMEKFPGIHFNFLCRYINPNCVKGALARRMESAEKFQTLSETFEKSIQRNKPETVQSLFQTFVEKGKPIEMVSTYYKKLPPTIQASTRSLYEQQVIQSAKDQITNIFQLEDFGQIKKTLDLIDNYTFYELLGEFNKKCTEEAKKANGKKDYLLQDCLTYLEERKKKHVNELVDEVFAIHGSNPAGFEKFLKIVPQVAFSKFAPEMLRRLNAGNLKYSDEEGRITVLRIKDLLRPYAVNKKSETQSAGKRKPMKRKTRKTK